MFIHPITWHLLNIEARKCIITSLGQPRRWAGCLTAQGWSKDGISTYIYWKHDIVIFQILSIFVTESTGISRDLLYTWSRISGYQIFDRFQPQRTFRWESRRRPVRWDVFSLRKQTLMAIYQITPRLSSGSRSDVERGILSENQKSIRKSDIWIAPNNGNLIITDLHPTASLYM